MKHLNKIIALLFLSIPCIPLFAANFPTTANNFVAGNVIHSADFNALENTIGTVSTTSTATLFGRWRDLFATTTMPQITTLTNLVSVGSITTGTWLGTAISASKGGTGLTSYTPGDILYADSASSLAKVASSTDGKILSLTNGRPFWTTDASTSTSNNWIHQIFSSLVVTNSSSTNSTTTNTFNITPKASLVTPIAGDLGIDTTSGQLRYADITGTVRTFSPTLDKSFGYATSTTWTGTSTRQLGVTPSAQTWSFAECYTTTGTLNLSFSDGSNVMNMISASSTPAKYALTSNNTFVADEKRQVAIGTPASSPVEVSCTIFYSITAD